MSNNMQLDATGRHELGKSASRKLRLAEQIPAVIYGGKKKPILIKFEARIIKRCMEEEQFYSQIITLNIDNNKEAVILKDLQRHPVKGIPMHLDFLRIDESQEINVHIPLHFINEENCIGVKSGGKLSHNANEVEVRCLPVNLPEFIEVDVAKMEIGSVLHLTDLKLPENVKLVQLLQGEQHNLPIVNVHIARTNDAEESDNDDNPPEEIK